METTTFHAQYALALQALGIHMEAHHLPAPAAVDTIEYHHFGDRRPTQAIRLRLPALPVQQMMWLDSVVVDDEDTVEVEFGHRSTYAVRLPDTGFTFQLVALRPHPLRAVSA